MINNRIKDFINSCLQYKQMPHYIEKQHNALYFFQLNQRISSSVYNKKYVVLLQQSVIYSSEEALLLIHYATDKETINIDDQLKLDSGDRVPVEDVEFALGSDSFRIRAVEYLFKKANLIGFYCKENFLRYYFYILYQGKPAILIVANENCHIVTCNGDFLEKVKTGLEIDFDAIISNCIFLKNIDKKNDLYDLLLVNFIKHQGKKHDKKHKILLVRYSKKQKRVLFVQDLPDSCANKNDQESTNQYSQ